MDINNMTEEQFRRLPHRKWDKKIEFDSLIILPARFDYWGTIKFKIKELLARLFHFNTPEISEIGHLHDSGYRRMNFVAVQNGTPTYLLSGCSDVIHIEGKGGYGYKWSEKYKRVPKFIPPSNWSIDCLQTSGLLRMWCGSGKAICGPALSSFEIYALPKKSTKK